MEKRRYPRIQSELPLSVKKIAPGSRERIAMTRVVGLGGCMFLNAESIGAGSPVELSIRCPDREIQVKGRVVYEVYRKDSRFEVGIEFLSIKEEDREILKGLFPAVQ
jgi:hypothetical protein